MYKYQSSILSNGTSFTADIDRLLKRIASSSPFEDSSMIGRLDLRLRLYYFYIQNGQNSLIIDQSTLHSLRVIALWL